MNDSTPLKGHTVLFTGKLASANRRQAHALVKSAGGTAVNHLSRKVTLVVVGMLGWSLLADGSISENLRKAKALQQSGQPLEIISEAEFLRRVGIRADDSDGTAQSLGSVKISQAAQMLNIDETLIRRWAQFGLVQTKNDTVDFQDLVALRTIATLIHDGLSTKQLAKALAELHRMVPDLHRPFAQARILSENNKDIVVELQGIKMDTHGQLLLDFSSHNSATLQIFEDQENQDMPEKAWQYVEQGLLYEEEQNWTEARNSYQGALNIAPGIAEAHCYLGNVLYKLQQYRESVNHYEQALALNADYGDAMYNLACTLEQLNENKKATDALKNVIAVNENYADAYFNLARLLVRTGKPQEALNYWRQYLQFDQTSDWAKIAKRQITWFEMNQR